MRLKETAPTTTKRDCTFFSAYVSYCLLVYNTVHERLLGMEPQCGWIQSSGVWVWPGKTCGQDTGGVPGHGLCWFSENTLLSSLTSCREIQTLFSVYKAIMFYKICTSLWVGTYREGKELWEMKESQRLQWGSMWNTVKLSERSHLDLWDSFQKNPITLKYPIVYFKISTQTI